ncbi:uncharacterized protein [Drosophila kikkawai]|uniref:Uncharacterized protein n=1 Tax=Drosophila kikkawai TaxID=30033 RepID=A0ABM3C8H0_DROKI|nr:uncharacterized protein LOC108083983 isoform X2 [Drosophila kikkawai]KAH8298293.1 hypothetical protein KR059_002910 [Drosophila kikkawai]
MIMLLTGTKMFRVANLPIAIQHFHNTASHQKYVAAVQIPIPSNVDVAEDSRFSPQRARDQMSTVILAQGPMSTIDITIDNSWKNAVSGTIAEQDPHVQSYDCFGSISLNSVMQSNVPSPFEGLNKFSHLNMPGGQWSQQYKFTSQNMQNSHYRVLRNSTRADWVTYDPNFTIERNGKAK